MRRSGPGSDTPAHTLEQGLAVVVGCTARIVVVGLDTTEHTTAQASALSFLSFPGSTPQMDEEKLPASQTEQKGVKAVRVLCSAVDVDSHQRTAVDHVHPQEPKHRHSPKGS